LLQAPALFSRAGNRTAKFDAAIFQRVTGLQQELVILDPMQTSDAENCERLLRRGLAKWVPEVETHPETMNQNLVLFRRSMVLANESAIELGDGDTKAAIRQFAIEVIAPEQQIGTVQRHTEAGSEKAGGYHSRPSGKISVVNMDVADVLAPEDRRKIGPQPGME